MVEARENHHLHYMSAPLARARKRRVAEALARTPAPVFPKLSFCEAPFGGNGTKPPGSSDVYAISACDEASSGRSPSATTSHVDPAHSVFDEPFRGHGTKPHLQNISACSQVLAPCGSILASQGSGTIAGSHSPQPNASKNLVPPDSSSTVAQ